MKRIHLLVLLSALALLLAAASARGSGSGSLVVGEVYAAGGNSSAVYANDYVELFNRGASPVAVDGWTLQYASAASASWQSIALSGTIPAGGRYLVQLASGGANGAALPAADATGTSNLAVTGGKVALAASACSVSPPPNGSSGSAGVDVDIQPLLSIALDHPTLSFPAAVPGTTPSPLPEHVTVTSNDPSGYSLSVHRTAFAPHDLPLGIGVGSGGLVAVPIAPAPDLFLAGASGPSADGGDTVATSVGFISPLPVVTAGHYMATLTFTVIGK
jgi:hypothetical protein